MHHLQEVLTKLKRPARGFTLVEILVVVVIVALLAAIAMPNIIRARMSANETQAIGHVRTLANSLAMYRFANNTYPDQWQEDMYPAGGLHFGPEMFNADLQSADFTSQGYRYRYRDPAGLSNPIVILSIAARPVALNLSGTRTFWVNDTNEIYHCVGESVSLTAPANAKTIAQAPLDCP